MTDFRWNRSAARRRRLTSLLLGIAIFARGVASVAAAPACPAEVIPCCNLQSAVSTTAHNDLQLGLQIWPDDVASAGDRLRALQPAAVRYAAGPSWRRTPRIAADMTYESVLRYVGESFDREPERHRKQADSLRKFFESSGAEAHFVIWEPPATADEPADVDPTVHKRTLPESAVTVTAMFYVATLSELKRRGFPIDVVELSNEPDGDWNILIPPARYVRLISEVRRQADLHGVELPRIAGPGVSRISALRPYLADPQLGEALISGVDVVSVHAWDDRGNRDTIEEARTARLQLDRLGYRKSILVSEFALTFLDPADRERGAGAHLRAPNAVSNEPAYAAKTMTVALNLAALGYGPLLYWEFRDPQWGKASYGLYGLRGERRPALEAWQGLGAISRASDRISVVPLVRNSAFALLREGRPKAVALVNASPKPLAVRFTSEMKRTIAHTDWHLSKLVECDDGAQGAATLDANGFTILELNTAQ